MEALVFNPAVSGQWSAACRAAGLLAAALSALALVSCTLTRPLGAPPHAGPACPPPSPSSGSAAAKDGGAAAKAPVSAGSPAAEKRGTGAVPAEGPVEVTVEKAVLVALENNQQLVVQRLGPDIVRTSEGEAWSVFDPLLSANIGQARVRGELLNAAGDLFNFNTESLVGAGALTWRAPTGTTLSVGPQTWVADKSGTGRQLIQARLGMTVTQALLRGFGPEVNLVSIRQARIDTLASEYELRGFAEAVVAAVEETYWDFVLAQCEIDIYKQSIAMAGEQLKKVDDRVKTGVIPAKELKAAEAEIAFRRQDMVDVESDRDKARVRLLRLMNPSGQNLWGREFRPTDQAVLPREPLEDVESHVQVGLRMRPDLNQTRLGIERGDLQIVKTRNGLLPKLDLFVTFGHSGYSESFGAAWGRLDEAHRYDLLVGVAAEYPLGNHAARALNERANLSRRQAEEAVRNMEQLVQEDIRTAYIEANRAKTKMESAAVTRQLDEEKLAIEMDKWLMGRSSSFQVARAQRDLVRSRVTEVRSKVEHLKALVELYRLEGSLLERRGVSAPGAQPPRSFRPAPGGAAMAEKTP